MIETSREDQESSHDHTDENSQNPVKTFMLQVTEAFEKVKQSPMISV